ncbi:MAG: hypothetical protein K1Y02_17515 [Candidatus Hydrogenedentes bacterium]|nr:hypothetical protein [Candidatus Hydrogenedentota bacterium]
MIRHAGCEVTTASCGDETPQIAVRTRRCAFPVELVIADLLMPGMNTLELVDGLKKRSAGNRGDGLCGQLRTPGVGPYEAVHSDR